jgi:uncharacterized membrane protein YkoI
VNLNIDCSPEQLEVLADHLLEGKALGVLPDEKHWMLSKARKKFPNCRILSADLDIANGTWNLEIQENKDDKEVQIKD